MEQQSTIRGNSTREEMFGLIAKRYASNTTVKEFCKQHGLTQGIYYYWQKKYHTQGIESASSQGGFASLQIEVPQHSVTHPGLIAEVQGIKLYQAVPAAYLKELACGVYVKS